MSAFDREALKGLLEELSECDALVREQRLAELREQIPALAAELQSLLPWYDKEEPWPAREERDAKPPVPPTIGPYEVLGRLGAGGMGEVYLARHPAYERRVAIKVLRPGLDHAALRSRFSFEREALFELWDEHVARILDAGLDPRSGPWIAVEFVLGTDLRTHVHRSAADLHERLRLLQGVVQGVVAIHTKGFIHRDLKPGNILVAEDMVPPCPKVIDFGIARPARRPRNDLFSTHFGLPLGTLAYMSPEQAVGDLAAIDQRTDVWSLGVIAYELVAEVLPRAPEWLADLPTDRFREQIARDPIARPSQAGGVERAKALREEYGSGRLAELDAIIGKALEVDPKRRYADARSLLADLKALESGGLVQAAAPSQMYRLRKWVAKHRVLVTATGALVALLLSIAVAIEVARQRVITERQETAKALAQSVSANTALQASTLFLTEMIVTASVSNRPPESTPIELIAELAATARTNLSAFPSVQFSIHVALADAFRLEGDASSAARELERARTALASIEQADPSLEQTLWIQTALLAMDRGDFSLADSALEHASRTMSANDLRAEERRLTARSLHGVILAAERDLKAGIALLEECAALWDQQHPQARARLVIQLELAECYLRYGALDDAEKRLAQARELLEIVQRHRSDELRIELKAARLNMARGRNSEALDVYERIMPRLVVWLGVSHPDVLSARLSLITTGVLVHGEWNRTIAEVQSLLRETRSALGAEHRLSLRVARKLAELHLVRNEYKPARDLLMELLPVSAQLESEGDLSVASHRLHLGRALMGLGEREAAGPHLRAAEIGFVQHFGPEHELVQTVQQLIASLTTPPEPSRR